MEYEVTLQTQVAQALAACRQRTTMNKASGEIRDLLSRVWQLIREREREGRRLRAENGHNVALYYWEDGGGDGPVEVGVQAAAFQFEETDEVCCSVIPAGTVATTAHYGAYDELGKAHEAVMNWCRQNEHEWVRPCWEVYGDWDDNSANVRTDVFYLLK